MGTPKDPVNKILADLGVKPTKTLIHYGEKEALVQIEVADQKDIDLLKSHKDIELVTDITKVALEHSADLGKNGVASSLQGKKTDGTDLWVKSVQAVE